MHCSLLSRNFLLVLGVATFHAFVLLVLLYGSFGGKRSFGTELLTISLVAESANSSLIKKSTPISRSTPQNNSFLGEENRSSIQVDGTSSSAGAEGVSHSAIRTTWKAIHSPQPHYPLLSRRMREQGLVVVKLCVNEQGIVGDAGISKSSGFHSLDQSALKTLAQWRFAPIPANDASFPTQCFQTPVQFTLES